jgi:hypothetical protein
VSPALRVGCDFTLRDWAIGLAWHCFRDGDWTFSVGMGPLHFWISREA